MKEYTIKLSERGTIETLNYTIKADTKSNAIRKAIRFFTAIRLKDSKCKNHKISTQLFKDTCQRFRVESIK